jgi:NADPH2:quinone reductase
MKAAVYYETGAPSVFRYEDVAEPTCAPDGLVIDVQAVSIEGGDVLNRAGGEMAGRPHIVGYQCAGVIREIGPNVQDRTVGQRVVAAMPHGSHAERVAVGANATWPVPDGLDVKEAACVPIAFGTAHDCLFEFGRLTAGESVLIQAGAGGVGLAAIQLAKRMGATVLATASSDDKLERLKEYGLDHGINYKTTNFAEEARRITGGKGVDLVVDSVGTTIEGSIQATGYRGRIIQVGNAGRAEDRRVDLSPLSALNRTFTGVFLGMELAMQPRRAWPMIAGLVEDVAKDDLRVVIDKTFPLAEAAAAHAYLESRQAFGRVVLIPWV